MSHTADSIRPTIGVAPPHHRREILALLFNNSQSATDAADLPTEIESLLADPANGDPANADGSFAQLWECRAGDTLIAALWLQFQTGRTASLFGPRCPGDDETSWSSPRELLAAALANVNPPQATQIQSLLDKDAVRAADILHAAGFEHLTDLLYLVAQRDSFPTTQ